MPTQEYYLNKDKELKEAELEEKRKDREQRDRHHKQDLIQGYLTAPFKSFKVSSKLGRVNAYRWWGKCPELMDLLCEIPSYYPTGSPFVKTGSASTYQTPTVTSLVFDNVWSSSAEENDGGVHPGSTINISAMRFQSSVRANNSRLGTYNPATIMLVQFAMVELGSFLLNLRRALQAYKTFNANNPRLAEMLIVGCGVPFTLIRDNYEEVRAFYNTKAQEFNELMFIPADFSYAERKWLLNSVVYADGKGINHQYLIPQQATYYKYDGVNRMLTEATPKLRSSSQFSYLTSAYAALFNSLVDSTVLDTIIADLKMTKMSTYKLPIIQKDESLETAPVDEVLEQIQNATFAPIFSATVQSNYKDVNPFYVYRSGSSSPYGVTTNYGTNLYNTNQVDLSTHHLVQDVSGFLFEEMHQIPGYNVDYGSYLEDDQILAYSHMGIDSVLLNTYSDKKLSKEQLVESTRLTTCWTFAKVQRTDGTSKVFARCTASSTEVLLHAQCQTFGSNFYTSVEYAGCIATNDVGRLSPTNRLYAITSINYHPIVWAFGACSSFTLQNGDIITVGDSNYCYTMQQLNHYFPITTRELLAINKPCWLSILYIDTPIKPAR